MTGSSYVGGIAGCAETNSSIISCYNSSAISGNSFIGGIVGQSSATVTSCYYDSSVYSGDGIGSGTGDVVGFATADMQSDILVTLLNNGAYTYNQTSPEIKAYAWKEVDGDYPVLDADSEPSSEDIGLTLVSDTYQITSATGLRFFAAYVNGGNTSINGKLMNSIDLGGSESNQWTPIGNYSNMYAGTFDGDGFKVSGLYINVSLDYQGLFGYTNRATISNLGVDGSVIGKSNVGGVVGYTFYSSVINCYNMVAVEGTSRVGGVVAYSSNSQVINCYNMGEVKGSHYVGGVVGDTNSATLTSCYNAGSVDGSSSVGSVLGRNSSSTVTSCYYDSSLVWGDINAVGYSTTDMQSTRLLNHLNNAAYTYNQTNPSVEACGWKAVDGGYPELDFESEPTYNDVDIIYDADNELYQIYSGDGLRSFADLVNGNAQSVSDLFVDNTLEDVATYFGFGTAQTSIKGELMNSISLGGESNEFTPIGNSTNRYSGTFDGDGYEVSGLYINQSSSNFQALFGYASVATIKSLGVSGSVTGENAVAGVVGYAISTSVTECYSSVTVNGSLAVGGIVGEIGSMTSVTYCYNSGSISGATYVGGVVGTASISSSVHNNYNRGSVGGTTSVGGVVGYNNNGSIQNSYSTVSVSGTTAVGGVVGYNSVSGQITNCYYNSTIYTSASAVGENNYPGTTTASGKSTTEMTGGSFATTLGSDYWQEDTGEINNGYPILSWQ